MRNNNGKISVSLVLFVLIIIVGIGAASYFSKPSPKQLLQQYTSAPTHKPVPQTANTVFRYTKTSADGKSAELSVAIEWNEIFHFVSAVQFTYPLERGAHVRLYRADRHGPIIVEQMNTHGQGNLASKDPDFEVIFRDAETIVQTAQGRDEPAKELWVLLTATRESSGYWTGKQILLDYPLPSPTQPKQTPSSKAVVDRSTALIKRAVGFFMVFFCLADSPYFGIINAVLSY